MLIVEMESGKFLMIFVLQYIRKTTKSIFFSDMKYFVVYKSQGNYILMT